MRGVVKGIVIVVVILALVYLGVRSTLNAPDEGGLTPLHFAALKGDANRVAFLLMVGAQADARTPDGQTPMHLAMDPDVVTVLYRHGADLNARTNTGETPLHFAIMSERPDVVQRLIDLGAEVNARNGGKETPLHLAAATGDTRVTALLLAHGADPCLRDVNGFTPQQRALRNHPALAQALKKAELGVIHK